MAEEAQMCGILINPADPRQYEDVLKVLGNDLDPHHVHGPERPAWHFFPLSSQAVRMHVASLLVLAGVDHQTIWFTDSEDDQSPARVVIEWQVGPVAFGDQSLEDAPYQALFRWVAEGNEQISSKTFDEADLRAEIAHRESEGNCVPQSFRDALTCLESRRVGHGTD